MWCQGTVACCLVGILLFNGIVGAVEPVAHKNFDEADEDLFAILAFLQDLIQLSEQSLMTSYQANGTLSEDNPPVFSYDSRYFENSTKVSDALSKKLAHSYEAKNLINTQASSFAYLSNDLDMIQTMINPIQKIVTQHHLIITTFENLTFQVKTTETDSYQFLYKIASIRNALLAIQTNLDDVNLQLQDISNVFFIESISNTLPLFSALLNKYESYLSFFMNYLPSSDPRLLLFSEETDIYLGDSYQVTGYFFNGELLVEDQEIVITLDSRIVNTTTTNTIGSYQSILISKYTDEPSNHTLSAYTQYQGVTYTADELIIQYNKIPTEIILNSTKNEYDPDESLTFNGRLQTYNHKGIIGTIDLSIDNIIYTLSSNATGFFNYTSIHSLPLGRYPAVACFKPDHLYESTCSNTVNITINYPTSLTLSSEQTEVFFGNSCDITGKLINKYTDEAISQGTIRLVINNHKRNITTKTNEKGWYHLSFPTDKITAEYVQLYAMYEPDTILQRSCRSDLLNITISTGFIASFNNGNTYYFLSILLSIILSCCIFFYFLRRNKDRLPKLNPVDLQKSLHDQISPTQKIRSFFFRSRNPQPENTSFEKMSLRKKIISQYRLLLRYLSTHGFTFSAMETHRDIEKKLKQTGSNKQAVESITHLFEEARYSTHPQIEEDIKHFDKDVFSVITEFRRE